MHNSTTHNKSTTMTSDCEEVLVLFLLASHGKTDFLFPPIQDII